MILGGSAFAVGLVSALVWLREPMAPLSRQGLAEARERWRAAGVTDYVIRYHMNNDAYDVTVRDGLVVEATVNAQRPRSESLGDYSVEGVFAILELELDNLADPHGPFAGRAGSVLARVRFDRGHGYVERYLRSAGGMARGAEIEVLEFTPLKDR